MKDLNELQKLWSAHEQKLQLQWNLNMEVLQKLNLDKIERKMNSFTLIKAISIAIYMIAGILMVGFVANKWGDPYLMISGSFLAIWSISIGATAIRELVLARTLDYSESAPELQKHLLKLRSNMINFLRIGAWTFPLYMAFVVVFFELVFGINIIEVGDPTWLISQVAFSVLVMIPLAIWMHRKLVPENADKKWMYKLLRGNGSQIMDSLKLLKEMDEMEKNG